MAEYIYSSSFFPYDCIIISPSNESPFIIARFGTFHLYKELFDRFLGIQFSFPSLSLFVKTSYAHLVERFRPSKIPA